MSTWEGGGDEGRPAYTFETCINAANFSLPVDGITDAGPAIRNALAKAVTRGGGEVLVPYCANGYFLGSLAAGSTGCLAISTPNITLRGENSRLILGVGGSFIKIQSTLAVGQTYITADTVKTDTTLTVFDTSVLTVGEWVLVELGQSPVDAFEPDFWLYAKVQSIGDATHVTLDRPVCYAMSIAGVPDTDQRSIRPLTPMAENITVEGFDMYNPMIGFANAAYGIQAYAVQHLTLDNLVGENVGAGIFYTQYCDHVNVGRIEVRGCAKQGSTSKGRGFGFGETRNLRVRNAYLRNCESQFIFAEGRAEACTVESLRIENAYPGRVNTGGSGIPIISHNGDTKVTYGDVWCGGKAANFYGIGGTTGNTININSGVFWMDGDPVVSDLSIFNTIRVRDTDYTEIKRYSKTFTMVPNDPTGVANVYVLPNGLARRLRIYVSTKTGLTTVFLSNGVTHGVNVVSSLTALAQTQFFGIGLGSFFNDLEGKEIHVATDVTMPASQFMTIEMEYFVHDLTDDGSASRIDVAL